MELARRYGDPPEGYAKLERVTFAIEPERVFEYGAGSRLPASVNVMSDHAQPNPWQGFLWLSRRECHRVLRLWTQTTLAPVVSSLLFIVVFGLSLGGRIKQVAGLRLRRVHRPRPGRDGDGAGRLLEQRLDDLPGPQRPLHRRRPRRPDAPLAGQRRLPGRRRLPGPDHRRRPRRPRDPDHRRAGQPAGLPRDRRPPPGRRLRRPRHDRRHLRRDLRPHELHQQHRHPPPHLPRRRLLLRLPPGRPLGAALPRQPALLRRGDDPLRLPRRLRREPLDRLRGGRRRCAWRCWRGASGCSRAGGS